MAIQSVPASITAFVGRARRGPFDRPVAFDSLATFERTFGVLRRDDTLRAAVALFFTNGGRDAVVCRVRGEDWADPIRAGRREGLWALDRIDVVALVCVPPPTFAPDADIGAAARVQVTGLCERRGAMFLADPPAAWQTAADITSAPDATAAAGRLSPNVAVYVPRLRVAAPDGAGTVVSAPCGAIAGVISRLDAARGIWTAPAGIDAAVLGTSGLDEAFDSEQIASITRLGVNALRVLPSAGAVVWGARTCLGADGLGSEWKYLPVRRMALHLEQSLVAGFAWTADTQHGERLWADVRRQADDFLHGLFRQGAFQGISPREAWFVRCDRTTMTDADIAAGRLLLTVGFAPLRPAEFVVIRIGLSARPA